MLKKFVPLVCSLIVIPVALLRVDAIEAQSPATPAATFETYMEAAVRVNRFRGTVLLARDGQPFFARAYGLANEELEVPNSMRTVFRIGSLTKAFTAAAVMLLQEQGKVSTSDPVCRYLDQCPAAWRPLTLRHLLLHTSGIPNYTDLPEYGRTMALPITHEGLLARVRHLPLDFQPGTQYKYSNAGYYILGVVIERASGRPYADYLQEHIFAPLGMASTGYDSARRIIKHRASGYSLQGGSLLNALFIDMTVPGAAGGLYSTAEDLLRWDQALYATRLLGRRSLDEMFTPGIQERGYGWGIRQRFGRPVVEHDGSINGFAASVSRYTRDRVTTIVLSNNRDVSTRDMANDLAAIVFGAPHTVPAERKRMAVDARTLQRYEGQYRFPEGAALSANTIHTVTVVDGRLMRRVNEGAAVELYPASDTDFFLDVPGIDVRFELDASGRVVAMLLRRSGRETRAEKIK